MELTEKTQQQKAKAPVQRTMELDECITILVEDIVKEKNLDVSGAKIACMLVSPNISKTTVTKIIKSNKELKHFSGYDFVLEISAEVWHNLDTRTQTILLEHQLRHLMVTTNEKTGAYDFKLRQHDIQDFSKVINDYGTDWSKTIKVTLSSIYDLTPAEEDRIII